MYGTNPVFHVFVHTYMYIRPFSGMCKCYSTIPCPVFKPITNQKLLSVETEQFRMDIQKPKFV